MDPTRSAQVLSPGRFDLLIKPAGSACNLNCAYCFYLEKRKFLYPDARLRMTDAVLDRLIRQYLEARTGEDVLFAWQGGEPTLMGGDFFRRAVSLQKQYANGRRVRNTLQTNGTLLNDEWGAFLAENQFLVGLSLDGPTDLHDPYRPDRRGKPTHADAMKGLSVLKRHSVEFNTLTTVNRRNASEPLRVYQFLKDCGSTYWQFIPVVERAPSSLGNVAGHSLATPPGSEGGDGEAVVTPWSVEPREYGAFLTAIFDRWVREDVGRVFVQLFDVALGSWLRMDSPLCLFAETCGRGPVIEHNGDVFACDHYVRAPYRLGNITSEPLGDIVRLPAQEAFGRHKSGSLPAYCRRCDVRFACHGECPKNRFCLTPDGEPGLNYLCPAYKHFFHHIDLCMRVMAQLVVKGEPAAKVMQMLAQIQASE